ncbi:heat-inducible transcriptional repressor HrcA [Trueperella sp. LYQ143]|uniref:heat-inducible transcriptional repressor HrcA n=1 Tax=unclassified Trueperella TaxID=2630174 RepID=UPI003983593C
MSNERRQLVLNAIVEDYVKTGEPVGSRRVVEHYNVGVSPATIRNDMAALEEEGLIVQPHTSAGRVPTDAGYRHFVDSLSEIKPLSRAERAAIERMLSQAVDLDDVIARAVRLLASITDQMAVVQYPALQRAALRHIEIVHLHERRILVAIITDTGRIEQRLVTTTARLCEADITALRQAFNEELTNLSGTELHAGLDRAYARVNPALREEAQIIGWHIEQAMQAESEDRVIVAGTANLTRNKEDFEHTIFPILDAIEEHVILLRMLAHKHAGLHVGIGHENESDVFAQTSVVSTDYVGADNQTVARLGIIGPTRMDYPATMSSVYAVATYLSHALTDG